MRGPAGIWIVFAVCAVLGLGTLGWLTRVGLRLERDEADARDRAVLEENLRLALWRLDSALSPLIAQENARPAYQYEPYYRASLELAGGMGSGKGGKLDRLPSPLLAGTPPYIRLHFEVLSNGRMVSPQVPRSASSAPGVEATARSGSSSLPLDHLLAVVEAVGRERFTEALQQASVPTSLFAQIPAPRAEQTVSQVQPPSYAAAQQALRAQNEYLARSQITFDNVAVQSINAAVQENPTTNTAALYQQQRDIYQQQEPVPQIPSQPAGPGSATASPVRALPLGRAFLQPVWIDNDLFLLREASVDGSPRLQGIWLDWPGLREWLLRQVSDLLPGADLVPARAPGSEETARMMASLPVKLVPAAATVSAAASGSPLRLALGVAWVFVVLAVGVGALLLRGILQLSERRADFVSAVTHELRTPLTTFRMYSEMLATGMVPEESKRAKYLDTLRTEAERLSHLVENVLAYARLERGRLEARRQAMSVRELLDRATERLSPRTRAAGMEFVFEPQGGVFERSVRTDPAAVEQVLFNLVDNACKYSSAAADRRVHGTVRVAGRWLEIRVGDHGPGIGGEQRARLFGPFRKSAREAAASAPGVGLGLALSRRLARGVGGDLRLESSSPSGTWFVLRLPVE